MQTATRTDFRLRGRRFGAADDRLELICRGSRPAAGRLAAQHGDPAAISISGALSQPMIRRADRPTLGDGSAQANPASNQSVAALSCGRCLSTETMTVSGQFKRHLCGLIAMAAGLGCASRSRLSLSRLPQRFGRRAGPRTRSASPPGAAPTANRRRSPISSHSPRKPAPASRPRSMTARSPRSKR